MFTSKWIRSMAVLSLTLVLTLPGYAQSTSSGYDRMDGDYVKPSKRAQPKRNFNLATQERADGEASRRVTEYRSASSATRANVRREDDREESRAVHTPKTSGRNREETQENQLPTDDTAIAPSDSGDRAISTRGYETTEASDVADNLTTVPVKPVAPVNDSQLVYCSKTLLEFHWNVECPMLKNVEPTRLTYKQATDNRFAECTSCGGKR